MSMACASCGVDLPQNAKFCGECIGQHRHAVAERRQHAARRRAMKAATENAEELTRLLTREANQARQAEITTEISEIVGGAAAV